MRESVEAYYSSTLERSSDLKTNACVTSDRPSNRISALLANIHNDVMSTYYGCGLVYPDELRGKRVLDLGCGSGRDCYVLSQLVGPDGFVVGVDMTDKQLDIANRHRDGQMQRFGYATPNVEFHKGYIEALDEIGLEPGSFDVIVSNCVINLSTDKPAVLRHAYHLLRDGGEMYFADVYADRRVADEIATDPVLYGECLGGALYWSDFIELAGRAGFVDPRLVSDSPIVPTDDSLVERLGETRFYSATYRLFKLDSLEPTRENYGQAVVYLGSVDASPTIFVLDKQHEFERGRATAVCGNTWRMLYESRFRDHFTFVGDFHQHFGPHPTGETGVPFDEAAQGDVTSTVSPGCC